jgi:hypothetical protein
VRCATTTQEEKRTGTNTENVPVSEGGRKASAKPKGAMLVLSTRALCLLAHWHFPPFGGNMVKALLYRRVRYVLHCLSVRFGQSDRMQRGS